jgi:uncharacterized protein (TIGR02271 family)
LQGEKKMNRTEHFEQPLQTNQQIENQPSVIPVIEEQLLVDKQVVEKGRVRISKRVRETNETVNIPLIQENVQVERIPVNQYVAEAPPPVRYEGNVMIIPVLREVVVVEKRLVLVEELRVTKNQVQTQETQKVKLLKEEVNVKRVSTRKS